MVFSIYYEVNHLPFHRASACYACRARYCFSKFSHDPFIQWRFGVAVTRWTRWSWPTQLLYIEPG